MLSTSFLCRSPNLTPGRARAPGILRRGGRWTILALAIVAAGASFLGAADQPNLSTNSKVVGRYVDQTSSGLPSILLRRPAGQQAWQRLQGNRRDVATGDTLVSLPGYRSEVHFRNGIDLTLWGDLPELSFIYPLLESVVVVNASTTFDLDLTLDRGRIILANRKSDKPARIRVRFANPAAKGGQDFWDITLPIKGAEVAMELWGRYPSGVPFSMKKDREGPQRELYLFVLKGRAAVATGNTTRTMEEPPGAALVYWDSRLDTTSGPKRLAKLPGWVGQNYAPFPTGISKENEDRDRAMRTAMVKALDDLNEHLKAGRIKAVLAEALRSKNASMRVLGVRCYAALNDLSHVLDALINPQHREVREVAIEELRHWIGLHPNNDLQLHAALVKQKKFTPRQAAVIMGLLHTFSGDDLDRPETYSRLIDYLRQDTPAIRELAHWHLVRLVPGGDRIPFDATSDAKSLDRAHAAWKKLVPEGSLPKPPKKS